MISTILMVLLLLAALGLFVSKPVRVYGFIPVALFGLVLVWSTWVYVPQGHVGVKSQFGITSTASVVPEGTFSPFGVFPWQSVDAKDVRVHSLELKGDHHFAGRTNDKVVVTFEVTQPIRVNPTALPWLLTKYKGSWEEFVMPYVSSSLRDAVASKAWLEVYQSDRAGLASLFMTDLQKNLAKVLQENGVPKEVADTAFILSDPQFGPVELPHEIQESLHKQSAVIIDQQTSILRAQVAENDVKTREAEGRGYSSLLTSLPKDVPASEAAAMMIAQARLKAVQVLDDAIKAGKVGGITFVIEGGTPPTIPAVHAPASK